MTDWRKTILILAGLLTACTDFSPRARREKAQATAAEAGWTQTSLPGKQFVMTAFRPAAAPVTPLLSVYIEGDGLAWAEPSRPSEDPTPLHPVALDLALRHPDKAVAYLGRPCQYQASLSAACDTAIWTTRRYSQEVVEDMERAVDALKRQSGARKLVLIGYSGGGAIAALIAARRDDVALLVTVAANMDTEAWTRARRLQPLSGSLNPAEQAMALRAIPQQHFVGGRDRVVDMKVLRAYQARFPANAQPTVREVPKYDHRCCWSERWPELITPLLAQVPPQ